LLGLIKKEKLQSIQKVKTDKMGGLQKCHIKKQREVQEPSCMICKTFNIEKQQTGSSMFNNKKNKNEKTSKEGRKGKAYGLKKRIREKPGGLGRER